MTVENDKIIKITEKELFDLYLDRGIDEIMSFPSYKERFIAAGCVVEAEEWPNILVNIVNIANSAQV